MVVMAILFRNALSIGSISMDISLRNSIDFFEASLNPSTTIVGWTSLSSSSSAFSIREPASTTTDLVPSPASLSTDLATSTSIFAIGCSISNSFKIVVPSFVIVTSPVEPTSILSMPLGPKLERITCAINFAAVMLFFLASFPFVSVAPSFKRRMGSQSC